MSKIIYELECDFKDKSFEILGQSKFGGIKRSNLKDSDFLFSKDRSFPIKTSQDVRDAISNFGHSRYAKTMSYDEFIKKLHAKAKSKGLESGIPKSTRDKHNLK